MEDIVDMAQRAKVKILEARIEYLESKIQKLQNIVHTLLYTTELSAKKILELEQYVGPKKNNGTSTHESQ